MTRDWGRVTGKEWLGRSDWGREENMNEEKLFLTYSYSLSLIYSLTHSSSLSYSHSLTHSLTLSHNLYIYLYLARTLTHWEYGYNQQNTLTDCDSYQLLGDGWELQRGRVHWSARQRERRLWRLSAQVPQSTAQVPWFTKGGKLIISTELLLN